MLCPLQSNPRPRRAEGRVGLKSHRLTSPHDEYRSTTGSPVRTSCVHSSTHSGSLCSTEKICRPPVQGRANGRRAPEENGRSKKATHRPGSRATGARHDQHARPPGSAIPLQGNRPGTVASPGAPRGSPPCGGPHNLRSSIRANRDRFRRRCPSWLALRSPRSVSGRSVSPVCWPDRLHAVSPWRAR